MMYNTMEENLLPGRPHKRRERDWLPGRAWFFIFGVFVGIFLPLVYQEAGRYIPAPADPGVKLPDLDDTSHAVEDHILKERGRAESNGVLQGSAESDEIQVGASLDHDERLAAIQKEKDAEANSEMPLNRQPPSDDWGEVIPSEVESSYSNRRPPGKKAKDAAAIAKEEEGVDVKEVDDKAKNEPGTSAGSKKEPGTNDRGSKRERGTHDNDKQKQRGAGDNNNQQQTPEVPKKLKKKRKSLNIENRYATIEVNSLYQRYPRATKGMTQIIRFSGSKEQVEKIPPFDKELSDVNATKITVDGANYQILPNNNPCVDSKYCRQYIQTLNDDESSFMPLVNTICDLLDMRISGVSATGIESCEAFSDAIQSNMCAPLMPNITVWFGSYVRTREYMLTNRAPKKKTEFDGEG